jgi:hypothetical protein
MQHVHLVAVASQDDIDVFHSSTDCLHLIMKRYLNYRAMRG